MPHVVSFLHGRTNSAPESSNGCGGNAGTFKEMFLATVSGGSPTQDGVCHPTSAYISSLFLQVRFCPRLTSRRPILSYAARTKRKFSCPKEPVFETNYESFTLKSTFVRSVHISCTVPSRLEHDAAFLLCSFEGFCLLQGCAERCLCSCLCQSRHAPIFSSMSTMAV